MAVIDSTYLMDLKAKVFHNRFADVETEVIMNPSNDSDTYVPVSGSMKVEGEDGREYYLNAFFNGTPTDPAAITFDVYLATNQTGPNLINMQTGASDSLSNPDFASDEIKNTYRWKTLTVPYGQNVVAATKAEMNNFLHKLAADTSAAVEYEANTSWGAFQLNGTPRLITWNSGRTQATAAYPSYPYYALFFFVKAKA